MTRHLFILITEYSGGQDFKGIVKAHSLGVNIEYYNDTPISLKISNVVNNHSGLVYKVIDIVILTETPIRGNLIGYVTEEADIIQFIN